MLRALFSVAALLVVLYLVMQLGGRQLELLKPSSGRASADRAATGAASEVRPAPTGSDAAAETARRITDAMQQGADQRAAEASR